ncbi:hypothetical protein HID58_049426 [Brassica napus]|uniref:IBB domain-containing protein n=1 Tax=Brassica napus TaxID=3708 RepID=A0ABQ8B5Z0_BRANA|nr:hypothetical protein HID58_049426 [Brassica napus]
MSLRPNEKTHVRRNSHKVAVDTEQSRRRRESNLVEIRKSRREEILKKKRLHVTQEAPHDSTLPSPAASVDKMVTLRLTISRFVIHSPLNLEFLEFGLVM